MARKVDDVIVAARKKREEVTRKFYADTKIKLNSEHERLIIDFVMKQRLEAVIENKLAQQSSAPNK